MNALDQQSNEVEIQAKLLEQTGFLVNQLLARYSKALLDDKFPDLNQFRKDLTFALFRSGVSPESFEQLRKWLLAGLAPFFTYPPDIEALVQLSILVSEYPYNEYAVGMQKAWLRLDTNCGVRYGRLWRTNNPIEMLQRERLWIYDLETMQVSENELSAALKRLMNSVAFRSYPPSIQHVQDAVMAVRKGALLIEDAWIVAQMANQTTSVDQLVRKAMGKVGSWDIRHYGKEKTVSDAFKQAYRDLLYSDVPVEAPKEKTEVTSAIPASKEAILAALGWKAP
ncbi:hypothetical protein ACYPKM_03095 [Pseudomonas aeruginosa]